MPLTAAVNLYVSGTHSTPLDLGTAALPFGLGIEQAFASGVGVGQADRVFTDTRTLAPSATENLDLAGTLTDAFGAVITMVTVKAVIIRAQAGNTNDVQVTRPASNGVPIFIAASDGVALKPGQFFAISGNGVGYAVTPATGDLLTVTNGGAGTSVNYDVIIIGTSA